MFVSNASGNTYLTPRGHAQKLNSAREFIYNTRAIGAFRKPLNRMSFDLSFITGFKVPNSGDNTASQWGNFQLPLRTPSSSTGISNLKAIRLKRPFKHSCGTGVRCRPPDCNTVQTYIVNNNTPNGLNRAKWHFYDPGRTMNLDATAKLDSTINRSTSLQREHVTPLATVLFIAQLHVTHGEIQFYLSARPGCVSSALFT